MKKRTRVIISTIGLSIMLGIVALLAVGGYIYYSYSSKNEAARVAGVKFGGSTDQNGCIEESLNQFRQLKENTFFIRIEQGHISHFTNGCLDTAAEVKDFCDGVPKVTDFLKGLEWTISKCKAAGVDHDGPANSIFREVEKKCALKKPLTVSYPDR